MRGKSVRGARRSARGDVLERYGEHGEQALGSEDHRLKAVGYGKGSCARPVPPPVPGRSVPTEAGHEFMLRDESESA